MSETRSRVRECVRNNPGIHFNEISRTLDIATGQTQYHLRRLRKEDTVISEEVCGRTHYFPRTYSAWERNAISLLRRETSREIVVTLLKSDDTSPVDLTKRLDVARSTVEWHLSNLVEYEVVRKQQTEAGILLSLERSDEVYRLLREIEPRVSDRLVDRFTRLADELLD